MSTTKTPRVQGTPDAAELKRYNSESFTLMPLRKPGDVIRLKGGKVKEVGKAPVHPNWTTRPYNSAKVRAAALEQKRNVGVRLTDEQLVIDVDPRNGGDKGFDSLCADLGIDGDAFPRVITGSGGWHCYMTKPADMLIRDTLESDDYDGVEFKSVGRQVVAAGSIHPNGTPYVWSKDHPRIEDGLPPAPKALLTAIKRPPIKPGQGGGTMTQEQIAAKLATLDPAQFGTNDKWFPLMQAVHHASGGDARTEWIDWSTSDPAFAGDAYLIGKRWDSLHADKAGAVTGATLEWLVRKHGDPSKLPPPVVPDDEFDDGIEDAAAAAKPSNKFSEFDTPAVSEKFAEFDEAADDGDAATEDDASWQALIEAARVHGYRTMPMHYDQLHVGKMLDHAERSLMKSDAPLYQMAGRIVHPVRTEKASQDDDPIRRPANALMVRTVNNTRLQMYMIDHAPFYRVIVSPNGGKTLKLHPAPMKLADQFISRDDKRGLRPLNGIIETPTLRRDGSLLQTAGYDRASGLLLELNGVRFKTIKDEPTRDEAVKALEFLKLPFKDFPFVPDGSAFSEFDGPDAPSASRSVMLSAMLTAVVRRSLPSAPAHGVTAPAAGTGKTLAIQCVAMAATGRKATATNQGPNEEEDEKRYGSLFLDGDSIILIDNCNRPVGGAAVCALLTTEFWKGRTLGKTESFLVPTNSTLFYNGNGLKFSDDMTRRALLCRMDAKMERPERRHFDVNLEQWVPANRVKLVRAALIVLRAFVVAGRPGLDGFERLGSFEAWSDLVRGALIWLGEPDPVMTQNFIVRKDPVKAMLGALLSAARLTFDGRWFTAGELYNASAESDDTLASAIEAALAKPSRNALGAYMTNNEQRIIDGTWFEVREDKHTKANHYRVVVGGGE